METEKTDKPSGTNKEPITTMEAVPLSSLENSVKSNKGVEDIKDPNNSLPGPSLLNEKPFRTLETEPSVSSEDSVKSNKGVKDNEDPIHSSPGPSSTSLMPFMPGPTLSNYSIPVTQSTGVQVMAKGYDPNRIPQSVFSSKPATPGDWSLASNESLFSIYTGNGSFNKDQFLFITERSYELTKPPELIELFENQKSNSLPTVNEVAEVDRKSIDSEDSAVKEDTAMAATKEAGIVPNEDQQQMQRESIANAEDSVEKVVGTSLSSQYRFSKDAAETATKDASVIPNEDQRQRQQMPQQSVEKGVDPSSSYRSSTSTNSANSFAFPTLPVDGERNSSAMPAMDIQQMTRNTETVEVINEEQPLASSTSRSKSGNSMKENQDKQNQISSTSPNEAPTSWGSYIKSRCPCFSRCICW